MIFNPYNENTGRRMKDRVEKTLTHEIWSSLFLSTGSRYRE
jgi:hypothetical protein